LGWVWLGFGLGWTGFVWFRLGSFCFGLGWGGWLWVGLGGLGFGWVGLGWAWAGFWDSWQINQQASAKICHFSGTRNPKKKFQKIFASISQTLLKWLQVIKVIRPVLITFMA